MRIILLGVYLVLTITGLICMKLGGNVGTFAMQEKNILFSINWISAIGFICYIGSFLLFTRIVVMFELSYIFPILTGIVQVVSLIASKAVFKEIISTQGVIGACLIIAGIIVMNLPKSAVTQ